MESVQKSRMLILISIPIVALPAIALALNMGAIGQSLRDGSKLPLRQSNLAVIALAALVIFMLVGGIIFDQHPCWAGVPNCD